MLKMAENSSEETMDMETEEVKPADEDILIIAKGQNGSELFFKMKRCTKIKKLLRAYCHRRAVDYKSTQFYINGHPFNHNESPDQLVLEDFTEIEVMTTDQVLARELMTALKITI